ncbi:MAG TPA: energy transducer TonB [Gemmatimonadaceae bacterium]|nr:energy transducer TonB [Gemmatimonadaceae bacterium]
MLFVLVESRRARQRSLGVTLCSIAVHAALVGSISGVGTPMAREAPGERVLPPFIYPPSEFTPVATSEPRGTVHGEERLPGAPSFELTEITDPPGVPIASPPIAFGGTSDGSCCAPSGTFGSAPDRPGTYFESMVDVSARALPENRAPTYPHQLREAGVEGAVLAEFVIDTTGRVDSTTIRSLVATHPLFERSVRNALVNMRFTPAESGGRAVRLLVRQSFVFRVKR